MDVMQALKPSFARFAEGPRGLAYIYVVRSTLVHGVKQIFASEIYWLIQISASSTFFFFIFF